jgi:DNA polymerase-3 subunit delta'
MFAGIVGQERAIETLERAAARPGHAYLMVGPRGSGIEQAARAFAALLLGTNDGDDDRARRLALRGVHPDIVEFEPAGASYRVREDVRGRILPEAARAPIESERKVLILFEAERLRGNQNESANAMLKTLEEPPARTVVLLVTSVPDDLLPTIRSRCQRIDFVPLTDDEVAAALAADGVTQADAMAIAAVAGGQLARARAFAGPLRQLRTTFASVPTRIDGRGATALLLAEELDAAVEAAASTVAARQQEELEAFDAEMERLGYEQREAQRLRRRIEERHKREARRTRIDLLVEGVTAIEGVYRDALEASSTAVRVSPRAAAGALDACREAREAFLINEKGVMRLTALLLALPIP